LKNHEIPIGLLSEVTTLLLGATFFMEFTLVSDFVVGLISGRFYVFATTFFVWINLGLIFFSSIDVLFSS